MSTTRLPGGGTVQITPDGQYLVVIPGPNIPGFGSVPFTRSFDNVSDLRDFLVGTGRSEETINELFPGGRGPTGSDPGATPGPDPDDYTGGDSGDPQPQSGLPASLDYGDFTSILNLLFGGTDIEERDLFQNDKYRSFADALIGVFLGDFVADRNYQRDQAALDAADAREAEKQAKRVEANSGFIGANTGLLSLTGAGGLKRYEGERSPGNASVRTGYGLGPQVVSTVGQDDTPPRGTVTPSGNPPVNGVEPTQATQGTKSLSATPGSFAQRYATFNQQRVG